MSNESSMPPEEGRPAEEPISKLTRAEAAAMTLLGVDWGRKRIGLAIKPGGQDWAIPQTTLTPANEQEAMDSLRAMIEQRKAQGVVVGLPLHSDPTQAQEIKRFCRKTRRHMTGVRWFFIDESLTTQAAEAQSLDKPSRHPADDLAAALILDTFLQTCR